MYFAPSSSRWKSAIISVTYYYATRFWLRPMVLKQLEDAEDVQRPKQEMLPDRYYG